MATDDVILPGSTNAMALAHPFNLDHNVPADGIPVMIDLRTREVITLGTMLTHLTRPTTRS